VIIAIKRSADSQFNCTEIKTKC